ncbi:hypothetical protein FO059_10480 [Tomitella fengzijianii]|uniref:Tat pathway signal protein n=2 Tax=Tomitella fengzijianii TaxID=2597660 RepID=A0A516X846_9ACTN|nr:hypothetical protein FO059_10480 [Tomitella fengzijianii]
MAAAAPLSRRSVLRSSGAVVLGGGALAVVGVTSAACTVGSPAPEPDPLEPLADQAGADAAQAERLAAADPGRAAPLGVIAAERRAHAAALKTEIHRAAGTTPDADDAGAATTAPTADTSPTAPPPPTLDGLRAQLADSRRSAADAARDLAGYRAGLAGSVAAACAAELKVLIP